MAATILQSPGGTRYVLSASLTGAVVTESTPSAATTVVLRSPSGSGYSLTVDDTGALSTTATATNPTDDALTLLTVNGTRFLLSVDTLGALRTVSGVDAGVGLAFGVSQAFLALGGSPGAWGPWFILSMGV